MSKHKPSELVAAAESLEQELARFDDAVASFKRLALSSKKNLDRGTAMLQELAELEQGIGTHIQTLVKAIGGTGEKQLARVAEVKARADELKERSIAFQALTLHFDELGKGAAALNVKLQAPAPTVVDVDEELTALATKAETLQAQAKAAGFDDVHHLADGLRQQLTAIRTKLSGSKET